MEAKELRATSKVFPPEGRLPNGGVIMSAGKTGLGTLERAIATMHLLLPTWEGGRPTDIDPKLCKLHGHLYLQQQCQDAWEPDGQSEAESKGWLHSRAEWFDSHEEEDLNWYTGYNCCVVLLSARMERTMCRTIMDGRVERPQDASLHSICSNHDLHRRRRSRRGWHECQGLQRTGLFIFVSGTQL